MIKKISVVCLTCAIGMGASLAGLIKYDFNPEVTVEAVLVDKWVDVRTGKYHREYLKGLYRETGGKQSLYERDMSSYNYHRVDTGTLFDLKMKKGEYEKTGKYDVMNALFFILPLACFTAGLLLYPLFCAMEADHKKSSLK